MWDDEDEVTPARLAAERNARRLLQRSLTVVLWSLAALFVVMLVFLVLS